MSRTRRVPIAKMSLLAVSLAASPAVGESPFAGAEFVASSDPEAVVLFVQGTPAMSTESHSMRLFGDGRLELTVTGRSSIPERRESRLNPSEREALISIAVNNGLAEWDTTRIESEKSIALAGRQFKSSDGYVVSVTLALETYRRGGVQRKDLTKMMSVASPELAMQYFPGVIEFRGLYELELYLRRLLKSEGLDS